MGLFDSIGGAVSDIFGAIGDQKAASGYKLAAKYSQENAGIQRLSNAIQQRQLQRETYGILGGQRADIAAGGLRMSGNVLDLVRASAQQASLSRSIQAYQGEITARGYEAEAQSYLSQASASNTKASGGFLGGALSFIGGIFSDARLKRDLEPTRVVHGIQLYSYRYLWDDEVLEGPLAQDIQEKFPEAVFTGPNGFLRVDFDKLPSDLRN